MPPSHPATPNICFVGEKSLHSHLLDSVSYKIYLNSEKYVEPPFPTSNGCFNIGSNKIFLGIVLLVLYETVIFTLTIWVGVERYRHTFTPLFVILYRDGICFFALIFIVSCTSIFVLTLAPEEYLETTLMCDFHLSA
ncbi:hypothetical protein BDZ94DRAFT_1312716 [Collybia nuda]|uniref:Uncharacterized protein n=1 Tax=Collybia nuda TaxID=64659 RepID=A0A9P5XXX7_9AGAR|nr:hypothetical protein BDZ94DRAFT_1312716 [Collybia nuda]